MIDFIPLQHYATVVYSVILAFIASLCVMLFTHRSAVMYQPNIRNDVVRIWGWSCFILLILLLGLRPISYAFGDMGNYNKHFLAMQASGEFRGTDPLFDSLMWLFSQFLNAPLFFFFCAVVYLVPILVASRKMLQQYWPLAFFFTIAQFDFYGYGVNGLRQGMAASVFLLAVVADRKWQAWIWAALAIGLHKSFAIPAAVLLLVQFNRNPRYYLAGWGAFLVVAAALPGIGTRLSASAMMAGDYDQYVDPGKYFTEQLSQVGFRLDFLLYSLLPIGVGGYFLFRKKVNDPFYSKLYCLYVGCNAFWLIMMHTAVSNRIAYLSWFLMGFVVAYPLVRFRGLPGQHQIFSVLLLVFYLFTFVTHT